MRVTIIKSSNQVYVDGEMFNIDLSGLPDDFHAMQWYGDHGEIETVGHSKPNQKITDIEPWTLYLEAHAALKADRDAMIERQEKDLAERLARLSPEGGLNVL